VLLRLYGGGGGRIHVVDPVGLDGGEAV